MKNILKINLMFTILGLSNTLFAGPTVDQYTVNQIKFSVEQRIKEFKLYGLNCTNCYIAIVKKVNMLPGVESAHFYTDKKILVVVGKGYSVEAIRKICESESQRIVG